MPEPTSVCLRLRTPLATGWLRLSWHPQRARLAMLPPGESPERGAAAELYSFAEQVGGGGGGGRAWEASPGNKAAAAALQAAHVRCEPRRIAPAWAAPQKLVYGHARLLRLPVPQLRTELGGKVLTAVGLPGAWERVAELGFGSRPGEAASHVVALEVMAR
jgi:hypothetical protein